jgi:hypothetical protein
VTKPEIPQPPKPVEEMTDVEKAEYAKILVAKLDSLQPKIPQGAKPGETVGEGLVQEYVPYSKEWFLDVEARAKEPEFRDGYALHTVIANKNETITVQGVGFRVIAGVPCKLPTPHYAVYMDSMKRLRELDEQFAQKPDNPQFTVYRLDGPWHKTPIEE